MVSPSNRLGIKTTLPLRPLLLTPKDGLCIKVRLYEENVMINMTCQENAMINMIYKENVMINMIRRELGAPWLFIHAVML